MNTTTEVYCTLQVEGTHFWPDCPLEEVAYLRQEHRHLFHIKAHKYVSHNDRDVEFIVLKHEVALYIENNFWDEGMRIHRFGPMSCEMIAQELITFLHLSRCEVSEDGENGAIVTVDPTHTPPRPPRFG